MERDVVRAIVRELKLRGVWVVKIHGGTYQTAGLPDLIACHDGRFIAIEVKDAGKPARGTLLQEATLDDLQDHGARTGVATSVDDAIRIVFG